MPELKLPRINRVQLSGRSTRDVVLRYAPDGTAVATLTVAFNRYVREGDGWREIPGFVGAVVAGPLAERCAERLHRGSALYLEGRLQMRQFRSNDGRSRQVIEIRADTVQFLERDERDERDGDDAEATSAARGRATDDHESPVGEEGELFPESGGEES